MVLRLPGTVTMDAGHTVDIGGTFVTRGCEVAYGRLVCLLLAGIAILALAREEGWVSPLRARTLSRIAAGIVVLWWMVTASGHRSLDNLVNLVFVAGCAILLVALFSRSNGLGSTPGA